MLLNICILAGHVIPYSQQPLSNSKATCRLWRGGGRRPRQSSCNQPPLLLIKAKKQTTLAFLTIQIMFVTHFSPVKFVCARVAFPRSPSFRKCLLLLESYKQTNANLYSRHFWRYRGLLLELHASWLSPRTVPDVWPCSNLLCGFTRVIWLYATIRLPFFCRTFTDPNLFIIHRLDFHHV